MLGMKTAMLDMKTAILGMKCHMLGIKRENNPKHPITRRLKRGG